MGNLKIDWNRKYTTIAIYAFLVAAASIVFYLILSDIKAFGSFVSDLVSPVLPIIYGFVVAYLLNPIMVAIEKGLYKVRGYDKIKPASRRAVSMLLTYFATITVLIIMMLIVVPKVLVNITNLYTQLQSYVSFVENSITYLLEHIPPELLSREYVDQITDYAGNGIQNLINWMAVSAPRLLGLVWNFSSGIITAFVAVIVSIYLLFAKERFLAQLRKTMFAFFPDRSVRRAAYIVGKAHGMFGGFITGKIIDSIIIGLLCFAGLSVMNMPNVVLVSFIVGVTNVLPYFGPFVGAVPGFILIAIVSPVQGLIFLLFILVLQQIDGNIIGPMILGDSIGLSAFWVVFAILFFGGVFGILGMFIGVPTFGVIYALIKEEAADRLKEKNLSVATSDYIEPIDTTVDEEQ